MLSVCITRWSTVMSLFLVMSTLQPFLLRLPTVQSSAAHDIVRHMLHQPSVDSNFSLTASRALANGLLGESSNGMPPDAQQCQDSLYTKPIAHQLLVDCVTIPALWLEQLLQHVGKDSLEYKCKDSGSGSYCYNLVASKYCTSGQFASLHNHLQKAADHNAQFCKPWPDWTPSLDSPPLITSEVAQCEESIINNSAEMDKCGKKVGEKLADITDPTELSCKTVYGMKGCYIKEACKQCESADKYLDFVASVWSPGKSKCNKWSSDEPVYKCSTNTLLIVGIILAVIVILVVIGVVVYCMCFSSDGSRGGSSSKPSSHHSRPPGSSAGAKQSSYA